MKLLKRDRAQLEHILTALKRGRAFLMEPKTLICRQALYASTTLHFANAQGDVCYSIEKRIGSELALLHTGIAELEKALNPNPADIPDTITASNYLLLTGRSRRPEQ